LAEQLGEQAAASDGPIDPATEPIDTDTIEIIGWLM
jgi:hypothetical protein